MWRIMSIFFNSHPAFDGSHTACNILFNNLIDNMLNEIGSDKNSLKVEIRRNEQTP